VDEQASLTTTDPAPESLVCRSSHLPNWLLGALEDLLTSLMHAPTLSQLMEQLGWRSRSSVHEYLERLRAEGVVAGSGR